MKVGILTLPIGRNYGGVLQNYALQQQLVDLGYVPETVYLQQVPGKRSRQANSDVKSPKKEAKLLDVVEK